MKIKFLVKFKLIIKKHFDILKTYFQAMQIMQDIAKKYEKI